MPRLNNDERNQTIEMLNAGMSATVVSQYFGCTRKTIERLRRGFRVTRNVADRPRSGRPRVTIAAGDRYIVLQHLCNRRVTAAATGRQYGIQLFIHRVSDNRLRQNVHSIRAYRPYFGQILTRRHRRARWDWCRRHLQSRRVVWDLILFSDECLFNLSHADGRERIYRRQGVRFADACVSVRDRFGGGPVKVWSGIIYSVTLTARAAVSKRALHKMVDTRDTDTFH